MDSKFSNFHLHFHKLINKLTHTSLSLILLKFQNTFFLQHNYDKFLKFDQFQSISF
jgi:hypothetical protein